MDKSFNYNITRVRMKPEVKQIIDDYAKKEGKTFSEMMREIVQEWLVRKATEQQVLLYYLLSVSKLCIFGILIVDDILLQFFFSDDWPYSPGGEAAYYLTLPWYTSFP